MDICVVHMGNVLDYPPVLSLVENLLNNEHRVTLVTKNTEQLPEIILQDGHFKAVEMPNYPGKSIHARIYRRLFLNRKIQELVSREMAKCNVLWTTTDLTVRILGDCVLRYKHIMQLMELDEWFPLFEGASFFKYPLHKYAQQAWRVVVPEENRAYMQMSFWKLPKKPLVLPNKPYYLDVVDRDEFTESDKKIIETLQGEKRKILLYLGYIGADRDLTPFADAIEALGNDYCFYILGKLDPHCKDEFDRLLSSHQHTKYLGLMGAPKHLECLKYADIGLLSYKPGSGSHQYISDLNALYCAPNKIFEYAGFGVPMIGNKIPGLESPFEKYSIGICSDFNSEDLYRTIKAIDDNHVEMEQNCRAFYESVDLDKIVEEILGMQDGKM